jgi:hypothetical protein
VNSTTLTKGYARGAKATSFDSKEQAEEYVLGNRTLLPYSIFVADDRSAILIEPELDALVYSVMYEAVRDATYDALEELGIEGDAKEDFETYCFNTPEGPQ